MSYLYQAFAGTGLTASAYLAFSQVGAAQFGIMPMIMNESIRKRTGMDIQTSVRAWDFFFTKATVPVLASVAVQSACYLAGATYAEPDSPQRTFLYAAAILGITPLPYTLLFIAPSIKILKGFSTRDSGAPLSDSDQKLVLEKLKEWNSRHLIRMGIYLITFITGLLGITPIYPSFM